MSRYNINVRRLVEFILRHGDITPGEGAENSERAQLGAQIHRRLQKQFKKADPSYMAEQAVFYEYFGDGIAFTVSGRADGVLVRDGVLQVDEIKTTDREVQAIQEPELLHLAQGRCYGAVLAGQLSDIEMIEIRVLYCNIETMEQKVHCYRETPAEAADYFSGLLEAYLKWVTFWQAHREEREEQLKALSFPYPSYRAGQRELAVAVYRMVKEEGKLFANAPTGIGKTVSVLFPSLKALGEDLCGKIFYLTARNAGALPPVDALNLLREQAPALSYISLTAKEKICPFQMQCDPEHCPRARGHYDRVNEALWNLICSNRTVVRDGLLEAAELYQVCPFELGLDCSFFSDVVIGDYNYLFDPRVRLARFFGNGQEKKYVFLIDEAHNLPDRVREMYTASLERSSFYTVAEAVRPYVKEFYEAAMEVCAFLDKEAAAMAEQEMQEEFRFAQEDGILPPLERFCDCMGSLMDTAAWGIQLSEEQKERILTLYFESLFYFAISDQYNEKFCFLKELDSSGSLKLTLFCADPSGVISETCDLGKAAVFFSGTLAPIRHYVDMLGGGREDPVIDVPSPFPAENRLSLAAYDVATVYRRRGQFYEKAAEYVKRLTTLPTGNYMVFFGSYQYLKEIESRLPKELMGTTIVRQPTGTRPDVREKFLRDFVPSPDKTRIGLCVLGGIYSEGVDLVGDRLSGVIVVGVGLPMICRENEVIRAVIGKDEPEKGFCAAYVYPGINKVLQAAGRVIRTDTDRGFIVFLDERYQSYEYEALMPSEYRMNRAGNIEEVFRLIRDFL